MNHQVNAARQLKCRLAGGGIAKNRQRFAGRRRAEIVPTIDLPPVFQLHRLPLFQTLKQRTRVDAVSNQSRSIESAGAGMLFDTIAVAFNRMIQRISADPIAPFIKDQAGPHFHYGERIIGP